MSWHLVELLALHARCFTTDRSVLRVQFDNVLWAIRRYPVSVYTGPQQLFYGSSPVTDALHFIVHPAVSPTPSSLSRWMGGQSDQWVHALSFISWQVWQALVSGHSIIRRPAVWRWRGRLLLTARARPRLVAPHLMSRLIAGCYSWPCWWAGASLSAPRALKSPSEWLPRHSNK